MNKAKILVGLIFILSAWVFPLVAASPQASASNPGEGFSALNYSANCEIDGGEELSGENCGIIAYIIAGINVLSALAGLAITASIMIAGYQYMTARDNAGQVEAARKRIVWAITALLLFVFMYAGLNFLVPGGVL